MSDERTSYLIKGVWRCCFFKVFYLVCLLLLLYVECRRGRAGLALPVFDGVFFFFFGCWGRGSPLFPPTCLPLSLGLLSKVYVNRLLELVMFSLLLVQLAPRFFSIFSSESRRPWGFSVVVLSLWVIGWGGCLVYCYRCRLPPAAAAATAPALLLLLLLPLLLESGGGV